MNRIFLVLFLTLTVYFSTTAQTKSLPSNIGKWKNADSQTLLNNTTIKSRLKKLLGTTNYKDFLESWETANPIIKERKFLFSSGCLIHACGHAESAILIDLVNNTIHTAIFREGEKTKFFNEGKRKTPTAIKKWANILKSRLD